MDKVLQKKYDNLINELNSMQKAVIAFSGGVDSTLLLYVAREVLGDNVIAVTASSDAFPERELNEAVQFCNNHSIRQIVFEFNQLDIKEFLINDKMRCYYCKKALFTKIYEIAEKYDICNIIEGTNIDDNGDYRPGMLAIKELGIKSPLNEAGLSKEDIRTLSRQFGLGTSEKPSFACLASRIPYGDTITKTKLLMIGKAEERLMHHGFSQFRVRTHEKLARIEICPEEFSKIISNEVRNDISEYFKELGFDYISLDLDGYKTGSMNKNLK